jgi:molecular chaperone DnaK
MARDNRTLGRFHLTGLPAAPRGVPQIEVAFDIDANGIVHATAKDVATGKEQRITITGSSGLSKADVDRMVKDAEAHAAEDKARRDLVDARNQAEALAFATEKTANEQRDRVPATVVAPVDAAIAAVRDAVQGDNVDAIRRATETLQQASHALAERLYAQQTSDERARTASAPDVKEGEVVDA